MRPLHSLALAAALAACHHEDSAGSVPLDAPIGAAVYVVNSGDATITVLDPDALGIAGTIALVGARAPHRLDLSPDGTRLIVADPDVDLGADPGAKGTGALFLLEAADGAFVSARALPAPNFDALFAPDQSAILTGQSGSPGAILRLDPETLITQGQIAVGDDPAELTRSADGAYLFSPNHGSGDVTVVAPAEDAIVTRIPVGAGPIGVWPGEDVLYLGDEHDHNLTEIDPMSFALGRVFDLGFSPGHAAVPPGGGDLWVSDPAGGRLTFWSRGDASMTGELATGAGARMFAFSADGARAFVVNEEGDSVSVVDVPGRSLFKSFSTGPKPRGLAVRAG